MIGIVEIKGVGKVKPTVILKWKTKGKQKTGYHVCGFGIHLNEIERARLPDVTKNKLDLYMSELNMLWKLKRIKTELDLEIFTNSFSKENGVGFLFNGKRHFKCKHFQNNNKIYLVHLTQINDAYYRDRYIKIKKEKIKEQQGE